MFFPTLLALLPLALPFLSITAADIPAQVVVKVYFSDFTVRRIIVNPLTTPPVCTWIPFSRTRGTDTVPAITAITADEIDLPEGYELEGVDFTIFLDDNALNCDTEDIEEYERPAEVGLWDLKLPYYAPGWDMNAIWGVDEKDWKLRLEAKRGGFFEQDADGNLIWPDDQDTEAEKRQQMKKEEEEEENKKNKLNIPKFPYSRLDDDDDDDDDDDNNNNGGGSFEARFRAAMDRIEKGQGKHNPSPEDQRRTRLQEIIEDLSDVEEEAKEEDKRAEESEEEEKKDSNSVDELQLLRRPALERTASIQDAVDSPQANPALRTGTGTGRSERRPLYKTTGRRIPNIVYPNPSLEMPKEEESLSDFIDRIAETNPYRRRPPSGAKNSGEQQQAIIEEADEAEEDAAAHIEDRAPTNRNIMAELNAAMGQSMLNYDDEDAATEESGEDAPDSPVDMTGNFLPPRGPDGGGPGIGAAGIVKKRDLEGNPVPTPTKRLNKRAIQTYTNPTAIAAAEPIPSAGAPASNWVLENNSNQNLYPSSQEPYKTFRQPAAFKINVKTKKMKPLEELLAQGGLDDDYYVPDPPEFDEERLLMLNDDLLDFISRGDGTNPRR